MTSTLVPHSFRSGRGLSLVLPKYLAPNRNEEARLLSGSKAFVGCIHTVTIRPIVTGSVC